MNPQYITCEITRPSTDRFIGATDLRISRCVTSAMLRSDPTEATDDFGGQMDDTEEHDCVPFSTGCAQQMLSLHLTHVYTAVMQCSQASEEFYFKKILANKNAIFSFSMQKLKKKTSSPLLRGINVCITDRKVISQSSR